MMNYKTMIDKDSMYNTPPCWCIYMLGLVLDWLEEQGGIPGMEKIKHQKAPFFTMSLTIPNCSLPLLNQVPVLI